MRIVAITSLAFLVSVIVIRAQESALSVEPVPTETLGPIPPPKFLPPEGRCADRDGVRRTDKGLAVIMDSRAIWVPDNDKV
jgi:hypothetical protein